MILEIREGLFPPVTGMAGVLVISVEAVGASVGSLRGGHLTGAGQLNGNRRDIGAGNTCACLLSTTSRQQQRRQDQCS